MGPDPNQAGAKRGTDYEYSHTDYFSAMLAEVAAEARSVLGVGSSGRETVPLGRCADIFVRVFDLFGR